MSFVRADGKEGNLADIFMQLPLDSSEVSLIAPIKLLMLIDIMIVNVDLTKVVHVELIRNNILTCLMKEPMLP